MYLHAEKSRQGKLVSAIAYRNQYLMVIIRARTKEEPSIFPQNLIRTPSSDFGKVPDQF